MKTKEGLNIIKIDAEVISVKPDNLTDVKIAQVTGGTTAEKDGH